MWQVFKISFLSRSEHRLWDDNKIYHAIKSWPLGNHRPTRWIHLVSGLLQKGFMGSYLKSSLCCDYDFNNPIRSHICICSDSSTIMIRGKLWPDLFIIFQLSETSFLQNVKHELINPLRNASRPYQSIPMFLDWLSGMLGNMFRLYRQMPLT